MNRAHLGAIVVALAVAPSAAAQEGLGAVVCVGSELVSTANAEPVRRVLQNDVELVYGAAVAFVDGDRIEAGLLEELEHTLVRCEWSEPGNTHVVVVKYKGVVPDRDDPRVASIRRLASIRKLSDIREHSGVLGLAIPRLTSIPGDRFDGFSVGYGTDWDGAEANARARIEALVDYDVCGYGVNVRLRPPVTARQLVSYYDNCAHEVIVRDQWNAGGARRADATREAPRPAAPVAAPGGGGGRRGGERFSDCATCPEMVVVPAGSFMMGSPESSVERFSDEKPHHRVTIGYELAVGVYEVTFAEWDACVNGGGCGGYSPDDWAWGRGSRPVIDVSFWDARHYVQWLSRETGEEYRLLTQAEWEYIARAGTQTERYWGDDEADQCYYANGDEDDVACTDGHERTAPVGSFRANAWGLYDVLGNVWEWTEDCWNHDYSGAPTDGSAWRTGDCSRRMMRGGSWNGNPRHLRSALRSHNSAGSRSNYLGFRVARTMN